MKTKIMLPMTSLPSWAMVLAWLLCAAWGVADPATAYVAYRFEPSEGWGSRPTGPAGNSRLQGRIWQFDFTQGAESISLSLPDRTLPGRIEKFRLRVRGSAKGHPLHVFLRTHFMTFHKVVGELSGDGEQELVFDAPPGPGWQWSGGENDGKLHGPLRIGSLRLEANGLKDAGQLELLSLAVDATCPPDRRILMTAETRLENGRVTFPVNLRAQVEQPQSATLRWVIRNWNGGELGQGQQPVTLPPRAEPLTVSIAAPAWPEGLKFAEAEFSLDASGQSVPPVQAYWLAPVPPYPDPGLQPDSPFGMGVYLGRFSGPDMERVAQAAQVAGVKWSREDFSWGRIEPVRGEFHWEFYDRLLDVARRHGITVYAIVGYWTPWTKPYTSEGVDDYVRFTRQLVKRYGSQIKQWEIWNEPNIFFWDGPKDLYAELLIKSYQAIKETDPQAQVLGISTAGIDYGFIETMLAKQTPFDVLTIHPYRKTLDDVAFINDLKRASDLVKRPDGQRRPVWLTEMGWATHVPHNALGQDFQPNTQRAQAELIARSYLCSIVSGIEPRTFWYNFRNDGDDPHYFEHNMGILRRDFSPKPAYVAYAALARVLRELRLEGPLNLGGDTQAHRFVSKDGTRAVVAVWNPKQDATVSIPTRRDRVTIVNTIGEERPLAATVDDSAKRTVTLELRKGVVTYLVED